ncbi:hypothetical protein JYU34_017096, partial [Plutella xylostella]
EVSARMCSSRSATMLFTSVSRSAVQTGRSRRWRQDAALQRCAVSVERLLLSGT